MTPSDLRAEMPGLQDVAYFNFGAHGPSPWPVVEAAESFVEDHEFDAPARENPYETAFDAYDDARETVASFVGATPGEIALTESTTTGIAAVAGAIDWEPGDVVVRTDLEHPAGILPWERMEREGVEVRVVETENGRVDREAFADAVEGARLACFSALTWTHGTELPVSDLVDVAHDGGALALVDAVQLPGQLPMDIERWGADVVAAAGHKWLLGLWGGGFLYVDADAVDVFEPRSVGYRSVDPESESFSFAAGARRFEIGSANPAPHVALAEAMALFEDIGIETVESEVKRLAARLTDGVPADRLLSPATPESGLVSVDVSDPAATVDRLDAEGVVVREIPGLDAVRASVHAVNTTEEVDRLVDALAAEWER